MKKFIWTVSNPQEWSPFSLWTVGLAAAFTFAVLFGQAFDANFPA